MHPELTFERGLEATENVVLLKHFLGSHYGHSIASMPRGWTKLFGPFFVQLGMARSSDELWTQAFPWLLQEPCSSPPTIAPFSMS